jgi:hypothetical protein
MFQAGEFRTCWDAPLKWARTASAPLTGSLETGEIVTLKFPAANALSHQGPRHRPASPGLRYGFEFLTLNDGQRDTIERVCQYLATKA